MHARIDQLLSLRDGEPVDAQVRVHVQHCTHCLAEASALARARGRMQELPPLDAPAGAWSQITVRTSMPPARRASWRAVAAVGALLIGAVVFVAIRDASNGPEHVAHIPFVEERTSTAENDVRELIAQSRELDQLLQYLPSPQVERVSLAATVDSIEERIQVLDWQLAYGPDEGLDSRQARRLWSERVELMDSLVKVRYAESAPMAF
jgi:hypothetical protein